MDQEEISFAGHCGLKISANMFGPKNGFPVLLAHGGGQTRFAWKQVTRDLAAAGYRAVAIDMRGHGDSEWSKEGSYDIRDFAADLIAIARQLGRPPALVGASLGGLAGMIAEGQLATGSFASLTLVDIAPKMELTGVMRVVGFMEAHLDNGFASPDEAAAVIADYLPHRRKRGSSAGLERYLRRGEDSRYYWHWDPSFIRNVMRSRKRDDSHDERRLSELSEAVKNIRLPVHLIRGGSSDLVSEDAVAHFRELVPNADFTDIADATHMVVGDANDMFSSAILKFLDHQHYGERAR